MIPHCSSLAMEMVEAVHWQKCSKTYVQVFVYTSDIRTLSYWYLNQLRRIRATANHSRDVPVVHMGSSVNDFFTDIEERTDAGRTLPNWHGELYLEVSGRLAKSVGKALILLYLFLV